MTNLVLLPAGDTRHTQASESAAAVKSAPTPRPAIVDALLDAHLCGERRWPLVSKILIEVDGGPRRTTRAEIINSVRLPAVDHVITLLLKRGIVIEVQERHRVILRRLPT